MLKRVAALLLALCLFASCACAEESVTRVETRKGDSYVAYPQLEGLKDESVQRLINDDIVLASDSTKHLITLLTLGDDPVGLQVDGTCEFVFDRYVSVLICATGKIDGVRKGQKWTALTYDLSTGKRVELSELFGDVDSAVSRMEEIAWQSLSEEMSGYELCQLSPLPTSNFTLSEYGITFWYPSDQFCYFSGFAGAVEFLWNEMQGEWADDLYTERTIDANRIAEHVEGGCINHPLLTIGQPMTEVISQGRLLRTPDEFPGGRYYLLEGPEYRDVRVLSDTLQKGYDHSVVEGVQLRRGDFFGLKIGQTSAEEMTSALGTPTESYTVSESMAYDYALPAGECVVYAYGSNELRLYLDEEAVLRAIQISRYVK